MKLVDTLLWGGSAARCAGSSPVLGTMFFVYALRSLTRNYIYVGLSNNYERRIKEHNEGYEGTTKPYCPFDWSYWRNFLRGQMQGGEKIFKVWCREGLFEKFEVIRVVRACLSADRSSPGHTPHHLMRFFIAEVVKLVDTHVSEACGASYAGSSPAFGTKVNLRWASPPSAQNKSRSTIERLFL